MRTIAIAKHDFVGQSETELSFNAGARIVVTNEREPGDWWKGEVDGKRGFFPSSFCEVCKEAIAPADPACSKALATSKTNISTSSQRIAAVTALTGQALVSQERCHGLFPTGSLGSGLNMQVPSQAGRGGISLTPSLHETSIRYVRALYDFEASRGDEMDLQRGAVYRVLADRGQWLLGENDTLTCRGHTHPKRR